MSRKWVVGIVVALGLVGVAIGIGTPEATSVEPRTSVFRLTLTNVNPRFAAPEDEGVVIVYVEGLKESLLSHRSGLVFEASLPWNTVLHLWCAAVEAERIPDYGRTPAAFVLPSPGVDGFQSKEFVVAVPFYTDGTKHEKDVNFHFLLEVVSP